LNEQNDFGILEKELSHFARAIGHPARVAVLLEIAKRGNNVFGEIIDIPPLSKTTVLQHLRELKRAGLIQGRIFGTKAAYSLDLENISKFHQSFFQFMRSVETTGDYTDLKKP
jgi:DNA-binding transcriptional ArsR family regulator